MTTPTDPMNDQTQPHEVAPAPVEPQTSTYTTGPEARPDWATPAWEPVAPEATGAAAPTAPVIPPGPPASNGRRATGPGSIVAAALLSAVLASGGTYLAIRSSGALDAPRADSGAPIATTTATKIPVTIDESSAIIDAAAKVSPAVVRIIVSGTSTDAFGGSIPSTGVGSGIIYDAKGWILTNRHVVVESDGSTASSLTVELKDGRQIKGTVYGIDTLTDLAIVKVDATGLPTAPIGSSAALKVGQMAIAIGSPLGTYSNSVTSGIVSATGRSITVDNGERLNNLIQTDAAINPGNSGGPLLDAAGNVIGINTAVATGSNGIGFAIPIDIARPVMSQALAGQQLARPYLGVRYQPIDLQLKKEKGLSVDVGALIGPGQDANGNELPAITPNGPAEKAGIRSGDIIVAIEDQKIDTEHPLDLVLSSHSPGETVTVRILRAGKEQMVKVTLGTRPAA